MAAGRIALEASGLRKAFGRTIALRDVSLRLHEGEAHGLVGENGAGKSSLLKLLTGIHRADAGTMLLHGRRFAPTGPAEARRAGLALVPQELRVVREMTVADNLLLGRWPLRRHLGGLLPASVDRRAAEAAALAALARLGLALDPRRAMRDLSFGEAQAVVLARELAAGEARILILDEPTASLERAEVDRLFALLKRMRAQGIALVFVSHRLDEVRRLCDRVTVLRDGAVVAEHARGAFTELDLARDMTGRALDALHAPGTREAGAELLAVPAEGGTVAVHAGRVTGLAGLLGAGTGAILGAAFGARRGAAGLRLRGRPARIARPAEAISRGIGYVPSERARALVPALSVRDNIILPHLRAMTGRFGGFDAGAADRAVAVLIRRLDIRPADPALPARALSGGNQQKLIFARWLMGEFHTLLLDEPTHGIDVAAKRQLLRLVDEFAARGGGVLLASAELHELLALADEVVALRGDAVAARMQRGAADFTEAALRSALGTGGRA
jgi:ABC-type sugar transport system ATPase subunit